MLCSCETFRKSDTRFQTQGPGPDPHLWLSNFTTGVPRGKRKRPDWLNMV